MRGKQSPALTIGTRIHTDYARIRDIRSTKNGKEGWVRKKEAQSRETARRERRP